jgi:hypothetical protein
MEIQKKDLLDPHQLNRSALRLFFSSACSPYFHNLFSESKRYKAGGTVIKHYGVEDFSANGHYRPGDKVLTVFGEKGDKHLGFGTFVKHFEPGDEVGVTEDDIVATHTHNKENSEILNAIPVTLE